ncbi:MAG: chemotaxis response regulator protein-glutamate methylesterase, partial [Clostridiales bacterium]|nr:chemotaxis response regulator protein-glutamate methylesterase [Clostridiales bacterium]
SGDIKVISTAKDGKEALEKAQTLNPDVITLDVEMPVMDGLTCLKELQKITEARVLMLSSHTKTGANLTLDSLAAGAIDFVTKPTGLFDITGDEKKQEIIDKVRMAKSIKKSSAAFEKTEIKQQHKKLSPIKSSSLKTVVAIGTSTGGPKALQEVIPYIPGDIPAAVLIVQHMPPGFTKSLAERLNMLSELTVKEAEDGDIIKPGMAYIAPGDFHMTVGGTESSGLKIILTKDPPAGGHRPAVNVMMNAVAKTGFSNVIAVIMTGMGSDGSEGIKNIKTSNKGYIISQDEKSCVVYGMPRAAALTGIVDSVVPLKKIADEIVKNLGVY